ncbi:hypothetical protein PAPYR_4343 [Paratrimastix pyriformis]|uniref:Uncharacterized protein n=1 Tax=Paratrimastix pyriformis TaxID=342808 RepID=A0ABQ8UK63_9EUKA|nr:hypothetical protein PAPYR_4343 [Paratrimastix pyriformis]
MLTFSLCGSPPQLVESIKTALPLLKRRSIVLNVEELIEQISQSKDHPLAIQVREALQSNPDLFSIPDDLITAAIKDRLGQLATRDAVSAKSKPAAKPAAKKAAAKPPGPKQPGRGAGQPAVAAESPVVDPFALDPSALSADPDEDFLAGAPELAALLPGQGALLAGYPRTVAHLAHLHRAGIPLGCCCWVRPAGPGAAPPAPDTLSEQIQAWRLAHPSDPEEEAPEGAEGEAGCSFWRYMHWELGLIEVPVEPPASPPPAAPTTDGAAPPEAEVPPPDPLPVVGARALWAAIMQRAAREQIYRAWCGRPPSRVRLPVCSTAAHGAQRRAGLADHALRSYGQAMAALPADLATPQHVLYGILAQLDEDAALKAARPTSPAAGPVGGGPFATPAPCATPARPRPEAECPLEASAAAPGLGASQGFPPPDPDRDRGVRFVAAPKAAAAPAGPSPSVSMRSLAAGQLVEEAVARRLGLRVAAAVRAAQAPARDPHPQQQQQQQQQAEGAPTVALPAGAGPGPQRARGAPDLRASVALAAPGPDPLFLGRPPEEGRPSGPLEKGAVGLGDLGGWNALLLAAHRAAPLAAALSAAPPAALLGGDPRELLARARLPGPAIPASGGAAGPGPHRYQRVLLDPMHVGHRFAARALVLYPALATALGMLLPTATPTATPTPPLQQAPAAPAAAAGEAAPSGPGIPYTIPLEPGRPCTQPLLTAAGGAEVVGYPAEAQMSGRPEREAVMWAEVANFCQGVLPDPEALRRALWMHAFARMLGATCGGGQPQLADRPCMEELEPPALRHVLAEALALASPLPPAASPLPAHWGDQPPPAGAPTPGAPDRLVVRYHPLDGTYLVALGSPAPRLVPPPDGAPRQGAIRSWRYRVPAVPSAEHFERAFEGALPSYPARLPAAPPGAAAAAVESILARLGAAPVLYEGRPQADPLVEEETQVYMPADRCRLVVTRLNQEGRVTVAKEGLIFGIRHRPWLPDDPAMAAWSDPPAPAGHRRLPGAPADAAPAPEAHPRDPPKATPAGVPPPPASCRPPSGRHRPTSPSRLSQSALPQVAPPAPQVPGLPGGDPAPVLFSCQWPPAEVASPLAGALLTCAPRYARWTTAQGLLITVSLATGHVHQAYMAPGPGAPGTPTAPQGPRDPLCVEARAAEEWLVVWGAATAALQRPRLGRTTVFHPDGTTAEGEQAPEGDGGAPRRRAGAARWTWTRMDGTRSRTWCSPRGGPGAAAAAAGEEAEEGQQEEEDGRPEQVDSLETSTALEAATGALVTTVANHTLHMRQPPGPSSASPQTVAIFADGTRIHCCYRPCPHHQPRAPPWPVPAGPAGPTAAGPPSRPPSRPPSAAATGRPPSGGASARASLGQQPPTPAQQPQQPQQPPAQQPQQAQGPPETSRTRASTSRASASRASREAPTSRPPTPSGGEEEGPLVAGGWADAAQAAEAAEAAQALGAGGSADVERVVTVEAPRYAPVEIAAPGADPSRVLVRTPEGATIEWRRAAAASECEREGPTITITTNTLVVRHHASYVTVEPMYASRARTASTLIRQQGARAAIARSADEQQAHEAARRRSRLQAIRAMQHSQAATRPPSTATAATSERRVRAAALERLAAAQDAASLPVRPAPPDPARPRASAVRWAAAGAAEGEGRPGTSGAASLGGRSLSRAGSPAPPTESLAGPSASRLSAASRRPSEWLEQGVYRLSLLPPARSESAPIRKVLGQAYAHPAPRLALVDWEGRLWAVTGAGRVMSAGAIEGPVSLAAPPPLAPIVPTPAPAPTPAAPPAPPPAAGPPAVAASTASTASKKPATPPTGAPKGAPGGRPPSAKRSSPATPPPGKAAAGTPPGAKATPPPGKAAPAGKPPAKTASPAAKTAAGGPPATADLQQPPAQPAGPAGAAPSPSGDAEAAEGPAGTPGGTAETEALLAAEGAALPDPEADGAGAPSGAGPLEESESALAARLFVVRPDGSGLELLRPADLTYLLHQARSTAGAEVHQRPLPGHQAPAWASYALAFPRPRPGPLAGYSEAVTALVGQQSFAPRDPAEGAAGSPVGSSTGTSSSRGPSRRHVRAARPAARPVGHLEAQGPPRHTTSAATLPCPMSPRPACHGPPSPSSSSHGAAWQRDVYHREILVPDPRPAPAIAAAAQVGQLLDALRERIVSPFVATPEPAPGVPCNKLPPAPRPGTVLDEPNALPLYQDAPIRTAAELERTNPPTAIPTPVPTARTGPTEPAAPADDPHPDRDRAARAARDLPYAERVMPHHQRPLAGLEEEQALAAANRDPQGVAGAERDPHRAERDRLLATYAITKGPPPSPLRATRGRPAPLPQPLGRPPQPPATPPRAPPAATATTPGGPSPAGSPAAGARSRGSPAPKGVQAPSPAGPHDPQGSHCPSRFGWGFSGRPAGGVGPRAVGPSQLEAAPGAVDFGRVALGRSGRRVVTIRNAGPLPTRFKAALAAPHPALQVTYAPQLVRPPAPGAHHPARCPSCPVQGLPAHRPTGMLTGGAGAEGQVGPGVGVPVQVELRCRQAGEVRAELLVTSPGQEALRVPLAALALAPEGPAPP